MLNNVSDINYAGTLKHDEFMSSAFCAAAKAKLCVRVLTDRSWPFAAVRPFTAVCRRSPPFAALFLASAAGKAAAGEGPSGGSVEYSEYHIWSQAVGGMQHGRVYGLGLHFFIKKFRREEPEISPAPEKFAGDDVKKVLSSIPVICYTKNEPSLSQISYSECSVCLSAIEEGEKVRVLPSCGHGFHARCIDAWLRTRLSCPVCRSDVTAPQVCVTMPVVVVEGCGGAAAGAGKREDNCSLPV
ncbi:hypothetical protein M5K25_017199 [Dendrobium thyrsiflorum]|uniref:RING-type E3 ubiquitin transferase n=1 Tax=Dendrobium thyrsiflorum TaxID=117978 RepID=A0ABD0UM57_DENTH